MRWLFLFVLVINIAYIVWHVSKPDVTEVMIEPVSSNARPIMLLSERKQLQNARNIQHQVDLMHAEQFEVTPQDEEEIPYVASDENSAQEEQAAVEAPDNEVPEVAEVQNDACFTVGPFQELETLRGFVQEIKTYVNEAQFRNREEKDLTVYWVYINPEKSRKDARKLGNRLKAKKIKDFYIIRTGEKNNGISLGHFKNKYRATKLTKKVKKLGFDVAIEPVFKTYTVYWLDYQIASDKDIPSAVFDKYMKSAKKDKVSRIYRDCAAK